MAKDPIDRGALRVAIAVLVGGITAILDSTIVSVALHQLAVHLHTSVGTIQWVTTGYLLALGTVIPLVGWLQSWFGAKRLWMGALTLFLIGTVLCSFAWSAPSLIAFRIVQGVGGGVMMPLMTTLIMQAVGKKDASRLMSIVALPSALGPILGPVIGGLILGAGSWRWLFLVNVPFCLAGLYFALRLIPTDEPGQRKRLDLVGLILLSPALVALLWGLSNASGQNGFAQAKVLIPMIGGAVLLAAFALWARRRKTAALVDIGVLRYRPTWASTALMFLSGAALYGAMLLLPLYWQELRGYDALDAGLLLIPQGVGSLLSRTAVSRILARIGGRAVTLIGFALVCVATVPFAFAGPHTEIWPLMIALLFRGLGIGMVVIPLMTLAFVGLERAQVPDASIVVRIGQQVGGSVGVALLAVILASSAARTGSLTTGFKDSFWWATAFSVLAVVLSVALPGQDKPAAAPTQADASAAPA